MSHEVEVSGNAVIATVPGVLDGEAARALSSALRGKGFPGAAVVIEMSGVSAVDVEGITQLVALKRWAERENGSLVLAAPSYEVMNSLRDNGLDRIFETAPSRDAALSAAGGGASHAPVPPPYLPTEAEAFNPPPPSVRVPDEPARRREADHGEANEWVKPAGGAARSERAAPTVAAAPPVSTQRPKKQKRNPLPVLLLVLLLLGGGAAAAWYFLFQKKPEVLPQDGEWTAVEGTETEFEIKFRNAATLVLKDDTLPDGLYLDTNSRDHADGLHSQNIKGDTRVTGTHSFSVAAKPAGDGAESPPVKFTFTITAEELRDTSGGKLRELMVNLPLVAGMQGLARGCAKATAEGLDGTGLNVRVDTVRRVAQLEGKPLKAGDHKFTVKAENADGKAQTFTYTVTVKPEPTIAVHNPALSAQQTTPPVTPTDPPVNPTDPPVKPTDPPVKPTDPPVKPTDPPVKPTDPPVKPTDPPVKPTDPPVTPARQSLDPRMLEMLSDRIEKSRFPEAEKDQMRAAVNQVEFAKKLATVKFKHGERAVSAEERDALINGLQAEPALKDEEARDLMDFVVIGYASKSGTLAQNIAISKARAASVESVLKGREIGIQPKYTGDYGATDVLGSSEEDNRVVEVYAVKVKEDTRDTLKRLIEHMKRVSGSR